LAAELRDWLAEKLVVAQAEARLRGVRVPLTLPSKTRLFDVPDKLSKILNRDLKAAGIAKRDDRGRTLDVHALRHTFGTLLSVSGVAPRVAQAAMRHSKLDLTMTVYTDDRMLDVAKAVAALPAIPPVGSAGPTESGQFAPGFTPIPGNSVQNGGTTGNVQADDGLSEGLEAIVGTALPVNDKGPLTIPVNEPVGVGATGLEPVTPSVSC